MFFNFGQGTDGKIAIAECQTLFEGALAMHTQA